MKRNVFKKLLALTLALCLCLSLAAPAGAAWDWSSIWSGLTSDSASTAADGTSTTASGVSQPFTSGTEGSTNFRIPAIVTLDDGTIVAAADARWSGTADGNGIDTLVAISKDLGGSWDHTWAAYLGNNKDTKATDSSYGTFIDPSLATDGKNVYLLVDLFPCGYSNNNTGLSGSALNDAGYLRLAPKSSAGKNESAYNYYLKFGEGSNTEVGYIYDSNGTVVSGYTVDRHFNLYNAGTLESNLFYSDAAYQVYPAQYLYFVKSTDGGYSWSDPELLHFRENSEIFYGACPGGGYVTSTGRIVFPCYSADTIGTQYLQTSVIYSDDGVNWTRSDDLGSVGTTSESTVSEVTLNGKNYLYLFTRSNKTDTSSVREYYVSSDNGATWAKKGDFPANITYGEKSALGSITYSELIDNCPAIIFSAPASTSHTTGVIYVGLVQNDGTIDWKYSKTINSNYFKYSDLVELSDGRVGLLYESSYKADGTVPANITFETFAITDLAPDATIGQTTEENVTKTDSGVSVTAPGLTSLTVTSTEVPALTGRAYVAYDITPVGYTPGNTATVTVPLSENLQAADKLLASCVVNGELTDTVSATKNTDDTASFNVTHFSTYAVYADTTDDSGTAESGGTTVEVNVGDKSDYIVSGAYDSVTTGDQYIATADSSVLYETTTSYQLVSSVEAGKTYYLSTSESDPAPTVKIQLESASGGYYMKSLSGTNSGKYIYPKASWSGSWSGSWSYALKTASSTNSSDAVVTITKSGSGFTTTTTTTTIFSTKTAYLTLTSENLGASDTSTVLYFYEAVETTSTEASTTITFTGTGEGSTTVTVGDTTYNVSVTAPTVEVTENLTKNDELDLTGYSNIKITSNDAGVTLNGTTITAGSTTGTATVTYDAVNAGNRATKHYVCTITVSDVIEATMDGPFVGADDNQKNMASDSTSYQKVPSDDQPITKLRISVGLTFNVDLKDGNDSAATWAIENTELATVDSEGRVTAKAAGTTYLTATVDGKTYRVPVEVVANDGDYTYIHHYYIEEITNSKAYYSFNCGDLIELTTGEVLYLSSKDPSGVCFFAAPIDGYALTEMGATLSYNGKFNSLRDSNGDPDYEDSNSFYKSSLITNLKDKPQLTDDQINAMIVAASNLGCDGGCGFTAYSRGASSNLTVGHVASGMIFRSEKLPEIKKEVVSVGGKIYEEGMTAKVGDKIVFRITVTSYSNSITYDPATLSEKSGFQFNDTSSTQKSIGSALGTAGTYYYDVTYTVKNSDIDTTITNTVSLAYTYKSNFSSGKRDVKAEAKASVSAVTLEVDDIVIDFGLPVTCDYSTELNNAGYSFKSGTGSATYGTVTVNEMSVTYTPNASFASCTTYDKMTFQNDKGGTYTIKVYPASNVLYEENFLTDADNTWTKTANSLGTQTATKITEGYTDIFGRDSAYDGKTGELGVWKATGLTPGTGMKATTTFYGNGFDLIGDCGPDTGRIMMLITNTKTQKLSALKIVDTRFNDPAVGDKNGMIYQVPLIHVELDEEGAEYSVEIFASGTVASTNVAAAAFSAETADDAFASILAARGLTMADAEFVSLAGNSAVSTVAEGGNENITYQSGTHVEIDSFRVYRSTNNSAYPTSEQNVTYTNIIDLMDGAVIAAYIENGTVESIAVNEYEANGGAESEIYLDKNQAISFKLEGYTGNSLQVSLRAVGGATTCNSNITIGANTEMYYEITKSGELFTITNTGDNLLAIGNIKLPNTVTEVVPTSKIEEQLLLASLTAVFAVGPADPETPVVPAFQPDIQVKDSSVSLFSKKVVTLTVTTSTDVETLEINGKYLRPTNAWMVKMGWSDTYTYVYVDTVKKGTTKTYTIVASDINGNQYELPYEA